MSLVEFATAVGVSENTIASVEYGGRVSRTTVEKLAAFLQCPVSELAHPGLAMHRRGLRARVPESGAEGRRRELVARLRALQAEMIAAQGQAIAAVRTNDRNALAAARQRQVHILAEQDRLIDGNLAARADGADIGSREATLSA